MKSIAKKRIAVFGSTGSVGSQTLEVIAAHPELFEAEFLTAHTNDELLVEQALKFHPNAVVIGDEQKYPVVKKALAGTKVKVFAGEKALEEVASFDTYDMMVAAIVGFAGLRSVMKAIEHSLSDAKSRTRDLGGRATTEEVGKAIAAAIG